MICFTHDRLTARYWFKVRELLKWTTSIVVFAVLFFALQFFSPWLAFGAALIVTFCLHFIFLDKWTIAIRCPHCKRPIKTNTPWVCGYKECRNENADDFPFIFECEHCQAEPKAYKCHYTDCAKLIFLSEDQQTINYAQCLNMPPPPKHETQRKKDEHSDDMTSLRKTIEHKELQVKAGKLDIDLKGITEILEGPKMKSLEDKYRAELKDEDDERRLRAEIDEKFKFDIEERKRRHLVLDKVMREGPW